MNRIPCRRADARCRGGIYIAVLGAAMLVTVIGVSALYLLAVQRRTLTAAQDTTLARHGARTAAEMALYRAATDANWRVSYTSGTWTTAQKLPDAGTYRFRFTDEIDGNLANSASESVRLAVEAVTGQATRRFSVLLQPAFVAAADVYNGGFEKGIDRWIKAASELEHRTDGPRSGLGYLRVRNRSGLAGGVEQDITPRLRSGVTYRCEAWVRATNGLADTGRAGIRVINSLGATTDFALTAVLVNGTWVKLSGNITPVWTGSLTQGFFFADTLLTTQEFHVDDVVLYEASLPPLIPVRGTYRQEIGGP